MRCLKRLCSVITGLCSREPAMSPPARSEEALVPDYSCGVNEPIALYQGGATLRANGRSVNGDCVLRYVWQPTEGPEVVFPRPALNLDDRPELVIPSIGLTARVDPRRITGGTGHPQLVGLLAGDVTIGAGSALSRLKFHIGNFPSVIGTQIHRGQNTLLGRIHLEALPWQIDIDPVPDDHPFGEPDLPDRISEERGFAITNVGQIRRADGAPFAAADVEAVLTDVSRTLSFARAAFSMPILRVGYDGAGAPVWKDWS